MAEDSPLTDKEYAKLTGKDPDLRFKATTGLESTKPNFFEGLKKLAGSGKSILEMLQGAKTLARASDADAAKTALGKIEKV
jgi:hypothetical protein